ncbi:hypothetical protein [Vibrio vulnificus YJ016]|uniref:Uncharacterized protein n=1 Tax=Vibrio vulnificus (strain YJ016) TaxID=196600 RepID=Q7MM79_VIBVY|nr:hypothetical protein [Vibrio vulnificus YJ016]
MHFANNNGKYSLLTVNNHHLAALKLAQTMQKRKRPLGSPSQLTLLVNLVFTIDSQ